MTAEMTKKANQIIKMVTKSARMKTSSKITGLDVAQLLQWVEPIVKAESMLLEVPAPVHVLGDIHGQVTDLVRLFDMNKWPPQTRYLFLGDYVDRGPQNVDTIAIMFAMKILYPTSFFMIRGNHETRSVNAVYGFRDELLNRFPNPAVKGETIPQGRSLWIAFNKVFAEMPLAALIQGRILCMHGGLSPHLTNLDQIRQLPKSMKDPPNEGLAIDLLWADPDKTVKGFVKSRRGVSYLFGEDAVSDKCAELDIDMVLRAHQVVRPGFEQFEKQPLYTLFSAPDYCGQFDNHGGVLFVDSNLNCKMRILPSQKQKYVKGQELVFKTEKRK